MTNIAFKLEDSGFTRPQIEALSEFMDGNVASKTDITHLNGKIDNVQSELKADIEIAKGEIKSELSAEIGSVKDELSAEIGSVRSELGAKVANMQGQLLVSHAMSAITLATVLGIALKLF